MEASETINKAIDFIRTNLENKISVDDVADFCGYSKFYFCRVFKQTTGESIHSFIKRLRIEQIAFKLRTEPHRTISDICIDYGISSANFTAAFKDEKKMQPYIYRKTVDSQALGHPFFHMTDGKNVFETFEECSRKISIERLPDFHVVYERFIGSYSCMKDQWCGFTEKYRDFIDEKTVFLDRTFDDPVLNDENRCMYDLAFIAPEGSDFKNTCVFEGGKFAVYHFKGWKQDIFAAYQNMFSVWFPETGKIIDNRYGFNIYRKIDGKTLFMEIDLCIPIK